MTFKIGDRVNYFSGNHGMSLDNPLVGTRYECIGTVDFANSSNATVQWDNGKHNSYNNHDLALAEDGGVTDPNMAFKIKRYNESRR